MRSIADELAASMANDKRTRAAYAYLSGQRSYQGERRFVNTPEDVVAEQALNAYGAAIGRYWGLSEEEQAVMQVRTAASLSVAAPYYWTTQVWHQLEAMAPDIPSHRLGDLSLGHHSVYWCTQDTDGIILPDLKGGEQRFDVDAYYLAKRPYGLEWWAFSRVEFQTEIALVGGVIPSGCHYPDDFAEGHTRDVVGKLLAGIAFLDSPYIPKSSRPLQRAARRRFGFVDRDVAEVTWVDLRPVANHYYEDSGDLSAQGTREWNCRWVVRGHWREQWYPSLGCHKLKYIPPYIKGPEDKPLKQTVYRVAR